MTLPARRVKYGVLVELLAHRQHVITDDGEHYWLTPGWDAAAGGKVGDRIELEYRATPSLGLWYGKVIPT